jgi:glycosyltransferase involved in cell wall biosynthesis
MKIAFVVHDFRRREGHSRYVVELATRFAREHEVHVFADKIEPEENSNIHFHRVPAWRASALGSILTFAAQATFRVRGKFDIIHNQGLCGWRGNVYTAHISNRAWHQALRRAHSQLTFRERVSGPTLAFLEHLFYRFARNCQIIAVSRRVAGDIQRLYHSRAPISVIYHGVDLEAFTPAHENPLRSVVRAQWGLQPGEMAFLFVGDMRKGGRQCIQALSQLPLGKLLFVSRSAIEPFQAWAAELGITNRVVFAGVSSRVEQFYAAADALLLPTHYDTFAMVVAEAMAAALPVIVSREAGASELIEPGVNGLLLDDFRDAGELAGKMRLLSEDRALAAQIGLAARQTVEGHSWDHVAAQTMQIYERQLSSDPLTHRPRKPSLPPARLT